ncbi:CRISPR/Cas system-associated endonuclease Cas3-HD [Filimonas zeae]|uniref:Uncharacterized protein n=1 Tax=Filimonas zeae TaxID=1737353 RepID=A0A917MZ54_9BACT|nr:hypothetical protein [Filimonas zeae]MDR6340642.1 CRISPR/Cas system-associated endonuclease Cas3-HD [Filimonas zeae]GGH73693.1 hypothetical protein GCM10011379_35480 [Filimonas zeae]
MGNTFESILTDLQLFVEETQPSIPRVLTSGKNMANWSDGRLKAISQLVINAVIIPRSEFEMRLERIQHHIEGDLNRESVVKTLSYYFEDQSAMEEVIKQLTTYYKVQLNAADVIKDMSGYGGSGQETIGFLLITIVETHILQ